MKIKKILLTVAVFGILGALCWFLGTLISPQQLQLALQGLGNWAALAYIGLFTLLPAFFFPVAVLALAGGLLFGLWRGAVYTFIGAVLNCSLMFFLARYAGRSRVEVLLAKKLSPQWRQRLSGNTGFALLVILRLIPAVPYNLINYAFGLTAMPFRTYILASAIGIIPGTFAFINIGDKALDVTDPNFWIAIGLLVLLLAVTAFLGKKVFPQNHTNGESI